MTIRNAIAVKKDEVAGWRRELHANPGLTLHEEFACNFVKGKLEEWGVPFKAGLAEYGVVATIQGAKGPGGSIGLRADMDALPIEEQSGQPWASTKPGVMHACGHDGHTAALLGTAQYLHENPNFAGKVHLIFQPAEEGGHGAERMIADGLFDDFPCDAVYGMHNWPWVPLGQAGIASGPIMASVDEFNITITGKGGHAAIPQACIDPIVIAAQLITNAQTLVSRMADPVKGAVVSFTDVQAGTGAHNAIPDAAILRGTIRSFDFDLRKQLHEGLTRMVNAMAQMHGAVAEIEIIRHLDATINDAQEAEFCADIMAGIVGETHMQRDVEPCMGGEDFGSMIIDRPGAYIWIGQGTGDADSPHDQGLHSPKYDFNDDTLPVMMEYLTRIIENKLS